MKHRNRLLSTTTLRFSAMLLVTALVTSPVHAFDPNEGADPAIESALPSTDALTRTRTRPIAPVARQPIKFAPLNAKPVVVAAPAPVVVQPVVTPSLPAIEATPTPASVQKIQFPPVDPAVMAKARQRLDSAPIPGAIVAPAPVSIATPVEVTPTPSMIAAAPSGSFIAPLPLMTPVAPNVVAAPVTPVDVAAPIAPLPSETLSRDSKTILSKIPSKMNAPKVEKAGKVALNRTSPTVAPLEVKSGKVDAYESAGIKISVRRPGLDTNYELNRAFTAYSGGDTATAIDVYKTVLSTEPTNQDALFGLASLYHRQGQLDKARPLYGELLKQNPNHRDGINNFLVLISDEAPQESLAELERLEQRNPDFSPIPAQQAVVLTKLGYAAQAREKMLRAIELSPENLSYKYNLAIMLDRQGNYVQAVPLYRLLIDAASKGAAIPAPVETLQKRLNFIATASNAVRTGVN